MKMLHRDKLLKNHRRNELFHEKSLQLVKKRYEMDPMRSWKLALKKKWVQITYESDLLKLINNIAAWNLRDG